MPRTGYRPSTGSTIDRTQTSSPPGYSAASPTASSVKQKRETLDVDSKASSAKAIVENWKSQQRRKSINIPSRRSSGKDGRSRQSSGKDRQSRQSSSKDRRSSVTFAEDRHSSVTFGDAEFDEFKTNEDGVRTVRIDLGSEVASGFSSKVGKFMDYYNEALRRRLIRELEAPVKVVLDTSTDEDNPAEDEGSSRSARSKNWNKAIAKTQIITAISAKPEEDIHPKTQKWRKLSRRKSVAEMSKLLRKLEVRKKWKKKVRIIIFCIRCVWGHCFRFRERSDLTPYMNTLNHIDYRSGEVKDLMFDRSLFRADRQARVPDEFRRIMSMRKSERSEQELYSAIIAMRNVKCLAILPARMQRMIAEVGQYESFESRRVITREGHPPSAYYFILSGAVVSMKKVPDRDIASAVAEYVKGETFEENVMVTESPREVTVLTKEPCEFLSISAIDYRNIYMQGGVKNLNDPDQEMFLKGLSFLEDWPLHLLQEYPKFCRFYYFKRGAILADDTKKAEWLFIVKSGSVSVLKKLKKVGPYEWKHNTGPKPLTEKERRERHNDKEQWRRYVLSELKLPLKQKRDIEEIEERVDGKPKPFEHPDIKVHMDSSGGPKGKKYYYPNLWTIVKSTGDEEKDMNKNFSNISKQHLYLISNTSSANDPKNAPKSAKPAEIPARRDQIERPRSLQGSRMSGSEISLRSLMCSPEDLANASGSTRTLSSVFDERIKTITAEVDIGKEEMSETDLNPQFVQIQTLIKGGVWGLADLMLDEQPSFMVVSNGADCVLLNKHFYYQHCSEKMRRKLTQELCPYPSDDDLQDSLQVSVDWKDYRRCELTDTMTVVRSQRVQRDAVFANT